MQTITVSLSDKVYRQIAQQSRLLDRSVEEHVVAIVADTLVEDKLPSALDQELAELNFFSDEELWQAAQITIPAAKSERMQELADKQQLEGLIAIEEQEAQALLVLADRIMLLRAKSAALLKERGHNIALLRQ